MEIKLLQNQKSQLEENYEDKLKKIIITGSEGLIGKETALYFKEQGYEVVECDISLGHDLTDEQFVKRFFLENKSTYLLNLFALNDHIGAEGVKKSNIFDVSLKSFEEYTKVNLVSLFSVCRQWAANNATGAIVNVSSLYSSISPDPKLYRTSEQPDKQKHIAYGVTKAGVEQLSRHLSAHLAPNIRVNCVAPGGVVSSSQSEGFKKRFNDKVLLKRQQKVNELFGIFKYLCSEESSYATGTVFKIDGGYAQV
tara:strand:+ start:118 stop:876 length:759 start_codon:yes stop_codon:yes gene_type:complete